jgi:hypothetical protein
MKRTARCTLLLLLASGTFFGQQKPAKPDFSGSWAISGPSENSQRGGTDTPFMRVEHLEPQLKVTFSAAPKSGQQDVWSLTTDGVESTNRIDGKETKSRTFWQGDSLVTEWVTEGNGKPVHHRQTWTLSKDGKRLTLAMHDGENEMTVTALRM